jgi:hypothetical protein
MEVKTTGTPFEPAYLQAEREGHLAILEKEFWDILRNCRLCPEISRSITDRERNEARAWAKAADWGRGI